MNGRSFSVLSGSSDSSQSLLHLGCLQACGSGTGTGTLLEIIAYQGNDLIQVFFHAPTVNWAQSEPLSSVNQAQIDTLLGNTDSFTDFYLANGTNPTGHAVFAGTTFASSATPEPSTGMMLVTSLGVAGMGLARRRRRSQTGA